MEIKPIKQIAEELEVPVGRISYVMKQLQIEKIKNKKGFTCLQMNDEFRVKEYIINNARRKIASYKASPEFLAELEKDRAERKELFSKLYGKETEKWFNPNWWPTHEDITPSMFVEMEA